MLVATCFLLTLYLPGSVSWMFSLGTPLPSSLLVFFLFLSFFSFLFSFLLFVPLIPIDRPFRRPFPPLPLDPSPLPSSTDPPSPFGTRIPLTLILRPSPSHSQPSHPILPSLYDSYPYPL